MLLGNTFVLRSDFSYFIFKHILMLSFSLLYNFVWYVCRWIYTNMFQEGHKQETLLSYMCRGRHLWRNGLKLISTMFFLTTMCKDFNFHFSVVFASCVSINLYVFLPSVFGLITSTVTWLSLPITFMLVGDWRRSSMSSNTVTDHKGQTISKVLLDFLAGDIIWSNEEDEFHKHVFWWVLWAGHLGR